MSYLMTYEDVKDILRTPISLKALQADDNAFKSECSSEKFPSYDGNPVLYPHDVLKYCSANGIETEKLRESSSSLEQYLYISSVKWGADNNNLDTDDYWYQYHLTSWKKLLANAKGMLLDIGADNPEISSTAYPKEVQYLGLDPILTSKYKSFRIFGLAEFLPIADEQLDNVAFGTSLDHVLDWFQALSEAHRILKKGGTLFLATLVWHNNAQLFNDNVHFHHFREAQILAALNELGFKIEYLFKKPWKNQTHREGLYLSARKI